MKSLESIMPQFFLIVIIIAIILSVLDTESISKLIGEESKFIGKKAAFYRNVVAFLFAFVVASFVGGILG